MVWKGFSFRWYGELFQNEQILEAFMISIKIASLSATFATLLGVMIGYSLVRIPKIPGRPFFIFLSSSPLVMPEIILGLSLLLFFISSNHLIGFEIVNREVKNIHDGDIRPIDEFLNRDVSLIAGIGDPEFLAESLKNKGINIHSIDVKDHEKIDLNTINEIENRTLFLTPKDLVKYSKDDFPKDTWELIPDLLINQADQEIILNKVMKII